MVRTNTLVSLTLLSCVFACSEASEGDSESDSSGGSTGSTSAGGTDGSAMGELTSPGGTGAGASGGTSSAASGGGSATGGDTATGGGDGTGGTSSAGICDPSGDTLVEFNNDDHTVYQATAFENGTVDPFVVCTTRSPSYGRGTEFDGRNVLQFYWEENGSTARVDKGAEACGGPRFHKEGWYGFQFYLPSPGFPMDKHQGIAQIFSLGGCNSWSSLLDVDGNNLTVTHRGGCGGSETEEIVTDIERNKWYSVVLHFIASRENNGLFEVWVGDEAGDSICDQASPAYRAENINFGIGGYDDQDGWEDDDTLTRFEIDDSSQGGFREFNTNEIEFKIGMYNFDDSGWDSGETRTLYYDNVSMLADAGEEGFMRVNPAF